VTPALLSRVNEKTPFSTPPETRPGELPPRRTAVYGPLTALLGLCALLLMGRANWSLYPTHVTGGGSPLEIPAAEKVLGSVESAGVSRRVVGRAGGKIVLVGWAAFADPHLSLSRMVILVDGVPRAEVHNFFDRSDIAARFGRQNFLQSGWEVSLPLTGIQPGDHNLTAEAFAETGESKRLRPVQLRVIE